MGKMTTPQKSVHEPDEELLSAEEAIEDAERLDILFRRRRQTEQFVALRVPLSALMEAIDQLDLEDLRKVGKRVEERLTARRA
jgi:hypothetical protein